MTKFNIQIKKIILINYIIKQNTRIKKNKTNFIKKLNTNKKSIQQYIFEKEIDVKVSE